MGFTGDIFIGIAASLTIFFAAGAMFGLKLDNPITVDLFIKIVALGVLSGFAGIRLLSGMSSKLLEKLSEMDDRLDKVEKSDKISELLRQADFLLNNNPDRALIIYDKALIIDPENEPALIGKAKALRRQKKLGEAIDLLSEIIKRNPKAERAYYNRACYKNLSNNHSKEEALADLRTAISLFAWYHDYAQDDKDFMNLWNDPDFKLAISGK
jgi:tetratricopeptide (TPR) repeat protein